MDGGRQEQECLSLKEYFSMLESGALPWLKRRPSFSRKKLFTLTLVGNNGMDVRANLSTYTDDKVTIYLSRDFL
jgi:hypothetical protein